MLFFGGAKRRQKRLVEKGVRSELYKSQEVCYCLSLGLSQNYTKKVADAFAGLSTISLTEIEIGRIKRYFSQGN
jgi:hypothetical protein